ncbi:MAG: HigA family addiction module antitoxin [Aestuariivirga sp.]
MMAKTIDPVSPGEMLNEEFLVPLGMSKYRLAKSIGVPAQRIGDIVAGKRGITADTDLRLCRFFGLSDGWWLRLQASYDTALARRKLGRALEKIVPVRKVACTSSIAPVLLQPLVFERAKLAHER